MKSAFLAALVAVGCMASGHAAASSALYDGSWNLAFVTQSGTCDPTYNFTVDVSNGQVTHPNLVRFKGYVQRSGLVHASVTVQDKYASGSGRLFGSSGKGPWTRPLRHDALPWLLDRAEELERFRAKWIPVRVKKTRQNRKLELRL